MRLKRLEIVGFKSFADKIKLEFTQGITGIVGPNGCGKSNISDAFRWVLGEQSAKSMRGSKMPDVIFAGTSSRKPLNFAEVTITLSDVAGALPIDYEEVSITRKLHRSGESEYFINRHLVRLKDVQGLFLDSGMGKDAYSIFEQGKIDQIINLSPLERRYIFEEAAGILRFLQRKKEALRKLEQTDLNVARVKDIHVEVEKQIIVLEEQSKKALEYKENKKSLEMLEKALMVSKWDQLQVRFSDSKKKGGESDLRITSANTEITLLHEELNKEKVLVAESESALKVRGEEVYKVRSTKELKSKEKETNQERLKEIIVKEKRWQREIEEMEERRLSREKERKSLLETQKQAEKRSLELVDIVSLQREKVKSLEEEVSKLRDQQQTGQREYLKLVQAENECESETRQSNLRLENAQEKLFNLSSRSKKLNEIEASLLNQIDIEKSLLEESTIALESQKELFSSLEKQLIEISEEFDKSQSELDRVNQELIDLKAREKVLKRLREDKEGFSIGSKQLLEEAAKEGSQIANKVKGLYEYFTPEKGAEAALAAVMRPYGQTLLVETEKDFESVLAYTKENQIKDVSLVCLEAMLKVKAPKASSVKGSSKESASHFSLLSLHVIENEVSRHFLQGIHFTKENVNPLEALSNGDGIEVALSSGVMIDRRSVVFFASPGENNVFLREAELKALSKKLEELEVSRVQWDTIVQAIQQKRLNIQSQRTELDKTIRRAEMRFVEINFALQKCNGDLDKNRAELKQLQGEKHAVENIIHELKIVIGELKERHSIAKNQATKAHKESESYNEQLSRLAGSMRAEATLLREKEALMQLASDEQRKTVHSLHVLDVKDLETSQQVKRLQDEVVSGRNAQSEIVDQGTHVDHLLKEVEERLLKVTAACSQLEKELGVRKSALETIEQKINEKRDLLKKYENERHQVGIQSAQIESTMQIIESEMLEKHKISLQEARKNCESFLTFSYDQIDKKMKALKHEIEAAGDINMTSIEECEKHKTRYNFLNEQIDDLDVSRQELIQIIADLDGESRKIFQETFEIIRANFKKNFKILFNGGEADLQFTETADVLEAGIDIIAQPPGKQMRSIHLMSGGEKCLTAMALLFAIFEVKPAPFCILDEIDAPLDDTNVERFVNIVKEFIDKCQFIIITHNKRTMAIADVLVGVSMEERGVSKLLSMDFSKTEVEVDVEV